MRQFIFTVEPAGANCSAFRFAYNPELLEELKLEIPGYARRWSPEDRAWLVEAEYQDRFIAILRNHGGVPRVEPARRSPLSPYERLWLREGAPGAVIKAAYRALAGVHHPDAGGNVEEMKQINLAFETLKKSGKV